MGVTEFERCYVCGRFASRLGAFRFRAMILFIRWGAHVNGYVRQKDNRNNKLAKAEMDLKEEPSV